MSDRPFMTALKLMLAIGGILLLAYWIDTFHLFLERHDNRVNPIEEVKWEIRKPTPVILLRISGVCGFHQIGNLGNALACRDREYERIE